MEIQSKRFKLVGGEIEVALYDIEKQFCELLFEDIQDEGLRLQKIFNFYDPKSELSKLNKERKINASKELLEVIKFSLPYCKLTKGEYDIAKGKQIIEQKKGSITKIKNGLYKSIKIKKNTIELVDDETLIDLGSVAKGYIGDKLAEFIRKKGVKSGFLDMRGDMICFGEHTEEIVIQHPREQKKIVGRFEIRNSSVATSGDYKQFTKDYDNSHIIGKQDLVSVTIVCKRLMKADILASVIFVLGKKESTKYLLRIKGVKAFLIDKNLNTANVNALVND